MKSLIKFVAAPAAPLQLSEFFGGAMAVRLDKVGRVARIILNQPEKMNAMTAQLVEDFGQVLENIHSNASEYGAVVITGAGKAFSAGGDQTWLKQRCKDTAARNSQIMHDFYHRFLAVRSLPLPVVAAINGPAVGAGMCLAMACDIRIAAKTAKMGFPFVSLGLHPGMGATHMIASVAGYETAYRLLLTGDMINGEEAMWGWSSGKQQLKMARFCEIFAFGISKDLDKKLTNNSVI